MSGTTTDRMLIVLLSASNFVIGMGAFLVIGMLTPLAQDLGLTPGEAGQVMTVYALSYAVLSPLIVSLTGRIGRRRVLALGMTVFALSCLLASLSDTALGLNLSRLVAACGAGLFTPVAAATAAGLSAPEERGRTLAAVFFGLTLAQVLGVPAGSFIAYTFGWRSAFLIVALLALPCLYFIWTRVPTGLRFQAVSLRDLGAVVTDFPKMLAVLFTSTFLAAIYVLYTYVAPLLEATMGFGRNGITAALLVFGLGAVAGNIVGGWSADRLGPRRTLLGCATLQVLCMPLFSMLPLPLPLLFLLIFVWSTAGWSFMASQQLRLVALAPEQAPVLLALNAAAIYVGAAIGSAIGGAVLVYGGLIALGVWAGIVGIAAVLHIIWSHRLAPQPASA